MARGSSPKEEIDFEWVKSPNSNAKTRRFFSRAEKKARMESGKKPASKPAAKTTPRKAAPKKAAPKRSEPPVSKNASAPKVTTTKLPPKGDYSRRMRDKDTPSQSFSVERIKRMLEEAPGNTTYTDWKGMSRKERQEAGLPVSPAGFAMEKLLRSPSRAEGASQGSRGRKQRRSGMAKGGMVKANCGASMKPNRKAKK